MRIIFFGTPEFAVATLRKLIENDFNVVAVVTAPDKPAGRGLELHQSPVKKYALEKNIPVLQPAKLKDEKFLDEIKAFNADLFIVVAFRMMPDVLWQMPVKGTFNLHASLLPQYRGAAPINHAIINGEKETGVTTFFLKHEIDSGEIIFSEKISIGENETTGELHDKLKETGANLVIKTTKAIESGEVKTIPQDKMVRDSNLKIAPKIFKKDCLIDWEKSCLEIHNLIRGLSPYPAAYTELLHSNGENVLLKIFKAEIELNSNVSKTGEIISDNKSFLKISCSNGFIILQEVQLSGKKKMTVEEFLRGNKINNYTVKN